MAARSQARFSVAIRQRARESPQVSQVVRLHGAPGHIKAVRRRGLVPAGSEGPHQPRQASHSRGDQAAGARVRRRGHRVSREGTPRSKFSWSEHYAAEVSGLLRKRLFDVLDTNNGCMRMRPIKQHRQR